MDIGVPELLIVLVIVVLLFGPGRLAGVGSELGRSIREFRQGLQGDEKAASEQGTAPAQKQDKESLPPQ